MRMIITIQHTQSVHHINGMVGSWTDWDLTELGIKQAKKIGERLKTELSGKKFVLYSSDLKRAKQTAFQVAKELDLIPILKSELRERNLGRCCGKSVQWLRENMEQKERTIDDKLFSDAESRRDEWNRLKPFYDEIMNNVEDNVIIVSHGDLLSVFNNMFLGQEVELLNEVEISGLAGGVSIMYISDEGRKYIKKISDMSYIQ